MSPRRFVVTLFSAVLLAGLAAGCDGPVGPPGPPGIRVFNDEIIFSLADAQVNGPVASVQYDAPVITPAVVQRGVVLAYFREQGTWTAMPYTYGVESAQLPAVDYTVTLGYAYEAGFLEVFYELSLADEDLIYSLPNQRIKIVVLETLPAARAVNLSNYEAVKAYYGLEE